MNDAISYHRPDALREACQLGKTLGVGARYLAGGTEMLVDWKRKGETAAHIISLQDVAELKAIRHEDGVLHVGAMASLSEIASSPIIAKLFPVLGEAVSTMGGVQVRNQATIGGNFCRAVPCADAPPSCIAGQGRLRLLGPEGERSVAADEFFTGPRQTVLSPGEILVEVEIPDQPPHSGASYQRFSLRQGPALAVASVAARITLAEGKIEDARVVMGAVAPVPLMAKDCASILVGQAPAPELFARASHAAAAESRPITDIRGSEEYRRHLVRVLTTRALEAATLRAKEA